MANYDFELDMTTDNSNSVILRNIKPETSVLEVGCAYGRMTKFLKEQLNCSVDIVEKDVAALMTAKQWARHDVGYNVERPSFFINLSDYKFGQYDYVIFADVLEHLHNPQYVLSESKRVLKDTGSIWISIPNIAHNSVLIDLWNNKFTYRDVGLLDNTHIKFFTESSLRDMVTQSGYKVVTEHNLVNVVDNTEFKNSYNDIPESVSLAMKSREFAEVYQFVWELKRDV